MQGKPSIAVLTVLIWAGATNSASAGTISFGLLDDPGQNYSFARSDSPVGQVINDPVAPYPGWLGSDIRGDLYGFFCVDYLKSANWNTTYQGTVYHVQDDVPGHTREQLVEAAFLSDVLYHLGGSAANTSLYQGPISFAIWQIMDPTPGNVPVDPAAQPYILQAQQAYQSGLITAANYPYTLIFVPDDTSIQDFMTVTSASPEPNTLGLFAGGLALVILGRIRLRRRTRS
jgi:hypothetical protein